tara:strand:+ start:2606 stop:2785 length:180 start_codon:yes stop_codon:yes gene_type:complete
MNDFLLNNWGELVIALLTFVKVVVNLTPTETDNKVFSKIDTIINLFVIDKLKNADKSNS